MVFAKYFFSNMKILFLGFSLEVINYNMNWEVVACPQSNKTNIKGSGDMGVCPQLKI